MIRETSNESSNIHLDAIAAFDVLDGEKSESVSEHSQMGKQQVDKELLNDPNDVMHLVSFNGTLKLAQSLSVNQANSDVVTNDDLPITQLPQFGILPEASANTSSELFEEMKPTGYVFEHNQMAQQEEDQEFFEDPNNVIHLVSFNENSIFAHTVNVDQTNSNVSTNHQFHITQLTAVCHSEEAFANNRFESTGNQIQPMSEPALGQDYLQSFSYSNLNIQPIGDSMNSVRDRTFFYGEENFNQQTPEKSSAMVDINHSSVQLHASNPSYSSLRNEWMSSTEEMQLAEITSDEYTMPVPDQIPIDGERNLEPVHSHHYPVDCFKTLPKAPTTASIRVDPTSIIDQNPFEYVGRGVVSHNLAYRNSMITPYTMASEHDVGEPISNQGSVIVRDSKTNHNLRHRNSMITAQNIQNSDNYDAGKQISNGAPPDYYDTGKHPNGTPVISSASKEKSESKSSLWVPTSAGRLEGVHTSPASPGWFPKYRRPAKCCFCFPRNKKGVSLCLFMTLIVLGILGGIGAWLFPR